MLRGRDHLENGKIEELADIYERFFLSRFVIPVFHSITSLKKG